MKFIPARNFTVGRIGRAIDWIVIHSMEAPEKGSTAENVASWFGGASAPKASAHYCIDNDSIVQCVLDKDIAWHAPGANSNGIGLEHAGYARQTEAEWLDDYGRDMLERSAALTAQLCRLYHVPQIWVPKGGLAKRVRGLTTHKQVTDELNGGKGHWDPGPGFPFTWYLERVGAYAGREV